MAKGPPGESLFNAEADEYLLDIWPTYTGREHIIPELASLGVHATWDTILRRAKWLGVERPADYRRVRTSMSNSSVGVAARADAIRLASLAPSTAPEATPLARRVEPVRRGQKYPVPPGGFRMGMGR